MTNTYKAYEYINKGSVTARDHLGDIDGNRRTYQHTPSRKMMTKLN
jgi:hypothetical protein